MTPFVLIVALVAAPTPKAQAVETPAMKAKAALDEVTTVVLENKTLTEFVAYVKAKVRVDVILDQSVLNGVPMEGNEIRLSANVREASLREGLDTALAPLGLKVGAVGGTIVISTEDGLITKQMRQKVSVASGSTADVLGKLKVKTGANIVIDPRLKKTIADANCDMDLSDVTLETAVRLTAEVSGFRAVRMGNVLFVTSLERAKELRADGDGPTQPQGNYPNFGGIAEGIFPVPGVPAAPINPPPPAP